MRVAGYIRMVTGFLLIFAASGTLNSYAMTNADLDGRYIVCQMNAAETLLYALEFDGVGAVTDVALINASFEVVTDDTDPDTEAQFIIGIPEGIAFQVSTDGAFEFIGLGLVGMVSPDGNFISFVRSIPGGASQLAFGIRESSGLSDSTLISRYFIHRLKLEIDVNSVNTSEVISTSNVIDASFNGTGEMHGDVIAGTIFDAEPVVSADYRVDDNGQMALDFGDTDISTPMNGIAATDGGVFAAVDTGWGDGDIQIIIGVRQSDDDLTAANFVSDYYFTELDVEGPVVEVTGQFIDFFGEMNFDGFDNFKLRELASTSLNPLNTFNGRMTVFTDGLFKTDDLVGNLQSDGQLFVASRIGPDLSGLQVGFAKDVQFVDPRREAVLEPVDHDDVCFIGTMNSR